MAEEHPENTGDNPRDSHVFLDFNGKISSDVFSEQVFLRIAYLHKKNPLVQVNDSVFKGTYDYSLGTNLFFEEIEDPPNTRNVFEKQTPIHLKHTLSEMKVISLKPVKIPQRKVTVPNEITKIDFNFNWDYNTLLEKFENGTLQIDDIVTKDCQKQIIETEEQHLPDDFDHPEEIMEAEENREQREEMEQEENTLENIVPIKILESEYEKLNILARRPVKRSVSPELVSECDRKYEAAYEYHNIERQILQPCDAFRTEKLTDIDEATLSDCVDIDRCILLGIIPPSSLFPRILSKKEKEILLSLENFDNLSLLARYHVLRNHVQDLEMYIKKAPKSVLREIDEFGRSPRETLKVYQRLTDTVLRRIQEIKASLENGNMVDTNNDNFQENVENIATV